MTLGGNRCREGPAERVNHRWEPAGRLLWLSEVLHHEGTWVASKQRELLVLSHRVIASTKQLRGDLAVVVRLAVATCG